MLRKHMFKHGARRNQQLPIQPTTPAPYKIAQTLRKSRGRDKTGKKQHHRCCPKNIPPFPKLTTLPQLLLSGKIIKFVSAPRGRTLARVKTLLGTQILVPAVRNMCVGAPINFPNLLTPGSFKPLTSFPPRTPLSNICTVNQIGPKFLRAPGTSAKISHTRNKHLVLLLPSGRNLAIKNASFAQYGTNATHDWHHRQLGGAGPNKKLGQQPIVRMAAKNPHARVSTPHRLKTKNKKLPWKNKWKEKKLISS